MEIHHFIHFHEPLKIEADSSAALTKINIKLNTIMGLIADFAAKMDAHNVKINSAIQGLTADVEKLEKTIKDLQEAPGEDTPANKALLDSIEAQTASISEKLTAFDEIRPPAVPAEPAP